MKVKTSNCFPVPVSRTLFLSLLLIVNLTLLILYTICTVTDPSFQPTLSRMKSIFLDNPKNMSKAENFSKTENKVNQNFPRDLCGCSNSLSGDLSEWTKLPQSTCSAEATLAGQNQSVISFTFFEGRDERRTKERDYVNGITRHLKSIQEFYPNWLIRLYSNVSLTQKNSSVVQKICGIICDNENLYFCPIQQFKSLGNLNKKFPLSWRFLPLGDPTVEKFLVRDLDGTIGQREADAVAEWEKSNFAFHGMRDNPQHCIAMMGGMWGGNNNRIGDKKTAGIMQRNLVTSMRRGCCGIDQKSLELFVYRPNHKTNLMTHDSYCCRRFPGSVPFPTRRIKTGFFVGGFDQGNKSTVAKCPTSCRPKYGKDWIYC